MSIAVQGCSRDCQSGVPLRGAPRDGDETPEGPGTMARGQMGQGANGEERCKGEGVGAGLTRGCQFV